MSKEYKSFGEYFDTQRIRIEKAMQNKNTQLHKEWREDFDKRQAKKQELSISDNQYFTIIWMCGRHRRVSYQVGKKFSVFTKNGGLS